MKRITNSAETNRREAEAWLAGALRWERVLNGLRHGHPDAGAVEAGPAEVVRDEPVRRAEAA